jgi:hypothetical protein
MLSNWLMQNSNQMPSATMRGFLGCVAPHQLLSELRCPTHREQPYAGIGINPGFTGDPRKARRFAPQAS